MHTRLIEFRVLEIDGYRYEHDVVIEDGVIEPPEDACRRLDPEDPGSVVAILHLIC